MSTDPNSDILSNGTNFTTRRSDTYPYVDPTKLNLTGRNVLISGASKGIGREIALSYAAAGASGIAIGARSDLTSLKQAVEERASEAGRPVPKVVTLSMDISDRSSVEAAAEKVRTEFANQLDIIINNAAVLEKWVPMLESDPDVWWNTWQTNVYGPYIVIRSFAPMLFNSPHQDRTIICMTSVGAHLLAPGASAYQSTKLAVVRLIEFVNKEYGDKGILAYALHPGSVLTEMGGRLPEMYHKLLIDKPQVSADTTAWLTGERREWLAGRYVACNWDMEELMSKKQDIIKKDLLKVRMAVT